MNVEARTRIADPDERLATALAARAAYYRSTQAMWTTADVEILSVGRGARGRRRDRLRGALRVAIGFPTWQTLTAAGLTDAAAADVAARFVAAASGP